MQHTVHQRTDAKVLAQPTLDGYQPPVLPGNLLLPWAASAAGEKRKRVDGSDSDEQFKKQKVGRSGLSGRQ
jgi:hypothetical protein